MNNKFLFSLLILIATSSFGIDSAIATDGGKWSFAKMLYRDPKAQKTGDILTVIIEEEAEVSMNAKNSSKKSSGAAGSISFGHPRVDNRATSWTNVVVPAWSLDTERSFEGDGSRESKDKFSTKITALVTDVMPNGYLLIEGSRSVRIHEELVKVILTGTVRPSDISRNNEVLSSRIANTTVLYESSGPLVKNVKRGIIPSLLNWLNPF